MRLFVAIEISNNNVINSIKKFQTEIKIDAKPIDPKQFHFTLQFLGEISEELTEQIIHVLQKIEFSSFTVNLRGVGIFPESKMPRIIWIGTDKQDGDLLIQLAKKVESMVKPLGLFSDKPFKPHITIFRIKKRVMGITKELDKQKMVDFGMEKVISIKLKQSKLTPNGPIYSDLMEIRAIK